MSSPPNNVMVALAVVLASAACACSSSTGPVGSGGDGGAVSGGGTVSGGGVDGAVSGAGGALTAGGALSGGSGGSSAAIAGASGSGVVAGGGSAGSGIAGAGGSAGNDSASAGTAGLSGSGGSAGTAGSGESAGAGAGGMSEASPVTFPAKCTCMNLGPPTCAATGHVTYTLVKAAAPTADQQKAYDAITCAMQGAIAYYDCNTSITKQLSVTYNPDVPTADGNYNGAIRFGGSQYMECVTAMHEIAHTVGVGTAPKWATYSVGGVFTGTNAIAQLRQITGNATDVLHSDTQHFWPYGLNYTSEATSTKDLIDHCEMVTAIRKDLGLQ